MRCVGGTACGGPGVPRLPAKGEKPKSKKRPTCLCLALRGGGAAPPCVRRGGTRAPWRPWAQANCWRTGRIAHLAVAEPQAPRQAHTPPSADGCAVLRPAARGRWEVQSLGRTLALASLGCSRPRLILHALGLQGDTRHAAARVWPPSAAQTQCLRRQAAGRRQRNAVQRPVRSAPFPCCCCSASLLRWTRLRRWPSLALCSPTYRPGWADHTQTLFCERWCRWRRCSSLLR